MDKDSTPLDIHWSRRRKVRIKNPNKKKAPIPQDWSPRKIPFSYSKLPEYY